MREPDPQEAVTFEGAQIIEQGNLLKVLLKPLSNE
jgi:hypothetical protein